jgi:tetratricopeptide (TPR) repeat protein
VANRKERRAAARNKGNDENANEALEPDAVLDGAELGGPGAPAMPFPDHEEDVFFKTQMRVLNLILGHWKTGLAVVGGVLLVVLAIGSYQTSQVEEQRGYQAEIADIDRRMPAETAEERFGLNTTGLSPEVTANVEEGARRYEKIASGAKGASAAMAWLKSGGAWKRAGDAEKALAAFGSAHAVGAKGVLGWSAGSQFAAAQADSGDMTAAIATLESMRSSQTGLESQQTDLAIAMLKEESGDTAAAKGAFQAFIDANKSSVLIEQATDGLSRLGSDQ